MIPDRERRAAGRNSNTDGVYNLPWCSSHFSIDDLVAVVSGQTGTKFSNQCLDAEKRLTLFFVQQELHPRLSVQPINISKTKGLSSARAIGSSPFEISCGEEKISWVTGFKYLGYWICPKLGCWLINALRLEGNSSFALRRAFFSSYVLPLFTWLFPLFLLFTAKQVDDLGPFFFTYLSRKIFCLEYDVGRHLLVCFRGDLFARSMREILE